MAEKKSKARKLAVTDVGATRTERDTLQRLTAHVVENPVLYAAATGFVALCLLIGLFYKVSANVNDRKVMTQYAKALQDDDPQKQSTDLAAVTEKKSRWTPEALYMLAETAIRVGDYEKAEQAFKRVRDEFSTSEYAPRAVEALAFLAENKGNLEAALAGYKEVIEKWPNSFIGRCQPLNIARIQENMGNLQAAAESYQSQVDMFPKSHVASNAEAALDRLRTSHPELFPKKEAEVKTEGEAAVAKAEGETVPAKAEGETATPKMEGESVPAPAPAPAPETTTVPPGEPSGAASGAVPAPAPSAAPTGTSPAPSPGSGTPAPAAPTP